MSAALVESMASDFEPEQFTDDYQAQLRQLIEAKLEKGDSLDTEETFGAEAARVRQRRSDRPDGGAQAQPGPETRSRRARLPTEAERVPNRGQSASERRRRRGEEGQAGYAKPGPAKTAAPSDRLRRQRRPDGTKAATAKTAARPRLVLPRPVVKTGTQDRRPPRPTATKTAAASKTDRREDSAEGRLRNPGTPPAGLMSAPLRSF